MVSAALGTRGEPWSAQSEDHAFGMGVIDATRCIPFNPPNGRFADIYEQAYRETTEDEGLPNKLP